MPPPKTDLLHFRNFLPAYVHTAHYLRSLYQREGFAESRFCNTDVYQSRSPILCKYILVAIDAVYTKLAVAVWRFSFSLVPRSKFMTPVLYYAVPAISFFLHILFIVTYNITSVQSFNPSRICAVFTPRH
jgi:hypothetical protein